MPRATVRRDAAGNLVLDDPDAVEVVRAIAKVECRKLLRLNADRMRHFLGRMAERGDSPEAVVVTCINVDDPNGGVIAEILMPGHDWASVRARGEIPIARGLAGREGMQRVLDDIDKEAAKKLRGLREGTAAIVVVDHGVAEVFTREDLD